LKLDGHAYQQYFLLNKLFGRFVEGFHYEDTVAKKGLMGHQVRRMEFFYAEKIYT